VCPTHQQQISHSQTEYSAAKVKRLLEQLDKEVRKSFFQDFFEFKPKLFHEMKDLGLTEQAGCIFLHMKNDPNKLAFFEIFCRHHKLTDDEGNFLFFFSGHSPSRSFSFFLFFFAQ
jgi:hypothetical protein